MISQKTTQSKNVPSETTKQPPKRPTRVTNQTKVKFAFGLNKRKTKKKSQKLKASQKSTENIRGILGSVDSAELENIVKDAFSAFDTKKDGVIDEDELRDVMKTLGENVSLEEVKKIMLLGDTNKTGAMNYDEFFQLLIEMCEKRPEIDK